MPSVPVHLDLVPSLTIFNGGSSFHRLKNLEKSDRRVNTRSFVLSPSILVFSYFVVVGIGVGVVVIGSVLNELRVNPLTDRGIDLVALCQIAILCSCFDCVVGAARNVVCKYLIQLMDTSSNTNAVDDDNFISNLGKTFSESLHIQDVQKSFHASEGNGICNVGKEAIEEQEAKVNMVCLKKSATFPIPNTMLPSNSSDKEADTSVTESLSEPSTHQIYSRSTSLPAPVKSAMKGSREKHGGSQVKLNVKWAPDVYDPIPTLLSHTVRGKKQQKSRKKKPEKKNGKKGQKGNSSRGGSSKDKQFRKLSGPSGLCYKSMDSCDQVIGASPELDAFDVRSQDSYCGTSFLKKSVTEVHYSVAEAL
ncbi:hypothetical protein CR513_11703, partial [Mucuna pruriens]